MIRVRGGSEKPFCSDFSSEQKVWERTTRPVGERPKISR